MSTGNALISIDYLLSDAATILCWVCEGCDKVEMSHSTAFNHDNADRIDKLVSVLEKLVEKCSCVKASLPDKADQSTIMLFDTQIKRLEDQFQKQEQSLESRDLLPLMQK